MKLALSHPGTGPFVQQTARALFEADLLARFWTTLVDRPDAWWRRGAAGLGRMVGIDLNAEFRRRAVTEIPPDLVVDDAPWEVLRTVLARMRLDARVVDAVWEFGTFRFDRHVARAALSGADGIYGYEYCTLAAFQEARRRGLARVYEVPSPEHEFVEGLIEGEIEHHPELDDGKRGYFRARQARRTARRRAEWALADVVIVNSTFTRDSYARAGLDVRKVRVVPLGAPPAHDAGADGGGREGEPLCALWAGTFSIRKGAHYLLTAWRDLAAEDAILEIYGAKALPDAMTRDLPPSIRWSPTVPSIKLFERYRTADVLVFPTLCDGFGLVVTEAFANGLPVITTTQAGASDLVKDGENGLIIPAGDAGALKEALRWCLAHRSELKNMRRAALATAARWQWQDFRQSLVRNVTDGLRDAGYAP